MTQSSPKAPHPNIIILEVRISPIKFCREHEHLVHCTDQLDTAEEKANELEDIAMAAIQNETPWENKTKTKN